MFFVRDAHRHLFSTLIRECDSAGVIALAPQLHTLYIGVRSHLSSARRVLWPTLTPQAVGGGVGSLAGPQNWLWVHGHSQGASNSSRQLAQPWQWCGTGHLGAARGLAWEHLAGGVTPACYQTPSFSSRVSEVGLLSGQFCDYSKVNWNFNSG